ncbi:MAG: chemotaxis protein CheX [Terracidiphilus sp.]|jgi:chemotaxis protein CheX
MLLNGVRKAAIARAQGGGTTEMEHTMAVSLRESVQLVSDPRNLDASIEEIFQLMLGVNCERTSEPLAKEPESVTAVVGFGGLLSGACVFSCGSSAAMKIAAHMTGMDFDEVDDTVKDGIGEICNMLAGAWKGKVPDLAANCGLSVPAVITGRDYNLRVQAPEFQLKHAYRFEDAGFAVTIVCDGLQ